MKNIKLHQRWLLKISETDECEISEWLLENGCTATYYNIDELHTKPNFYAYFQSTSKEELLIIENKFLAKFIDVNIISIEEFSDEDWLIKSREGFVSIPVGQTLFIQPIWSDTLVPDNRTHIVVNPGIAFGTGGHETTRLCMILLEELSKNGQLLDPVLDIGSGTGILSLTAFILGAQNITAIDNDENCGPAMHELCMLNKHISNECKPFNYYIGTIDNLNLQKNYQTVIMNILLETIQYLLPNIINICSSGCMLIASGINIEKQDEALISLASYGFKPVKIITEEKWIAVLAKLS